MEKTENLIILDYGSQYTQLIARRSRELGVFSLILPFTASIEEIKKHNPVGIILSGGPSSVNEKDSPKLNLGILDLGVPVLGVCYGLQLLALNLGGKVENSNSREYGLSTLEVVSTKSSLLKQEYDNSNIWLSHGDHVAKAPEGFAITAYSNGIICGVENVEKNIYGIQFHPEVYHSEFGKDVLQNFLVAISGFSQNWSKKSFIGNETAKIKALVGADKVVCALSGGVDSSVAATLVGRAIGSQQTCIFVDTGLLRLGEYEEVLAAYKSIGLNVKPIKAAERFYKLLKGVDDPERKRKIIGGEFIKIFDEEAKRITGVKYLVQGTLYPDVIESVSVKGPSATIKSHHNVGGLPEDMELNLIEPLRELFKDEVREIGKELGLPLYITGRQPFPGPGLAIRIIGAVDAASVDLLQRADKIVREEIESAKPEDYPWQFFAVLLPIKSVGVMGDGRTYEQVVAVRAVSSTDGMTADWTKLPYPLLEKISSRIVSEVRGINRVVYDITSKPPGTIEWE